MSSVQGVMLATAMAAVSGTAFVIFAIKLQKSISPSPDAHFQSDFTPPRSCISSGGRKGDKKKKKKVRFAKDVVEPSGNNEEFRKRFSAQIERKNVAAGSTAVRGGMPANRVALYNGILRDRVVNRMGYSY